MEIKDSASVDWLEADDGGTLVQEIEVNQSVGQQEMMYRPDL